MGAVVVDAPPQAAAPKVRLDVAAAAATHDDSDAEPPPRFGSVGDAGAGAPVVCCEFPQARLAAEGEDLVCEGVGDCEDGVVGEEEVDVVLTKAVAEFEEGVDEVEDGRRREFEGDAAEVNVLGEVACDGDGGVWAGRGGVCCVGGGSGDGG